MFESVTGLGFGVRVFLLDFDEDVSVSWADAFMAEGFEVRRDMAFLKVAAVRFGQAFRSGVPGPMALGKETGSAGLDAVVMDVRSDLNK